MTGADFRDYVGELKKIPNAEGRKDDKGEIIMVDSVGDVKKFRDVA